MSILRLLDWHSIRALLLWHSIRWFDDLQGMTFDHWQTRVEEADTSPNPSKKKYKNVVIGLLVEEVDDYLIRSWCSGVVVCDARSCRDANRRVEHDAVR
jgi:hypothetical protein